MKDRCRDYTAPWDNTNQKVTGLEAWGAQALEDLWSDLEEETRAYLHKPAASWQEQEGIILEQFIETACRDFKGREDTVNHLLGIAASPVSDDAVPGACVSGSPGSGKSALFSTIARRLKGQGVFVLAHAAGISVRASQVDALLRRWIGSWQVILG